MVERRLVKPGVESSNLSSSSKVSATEKVSGYGLKHLHHGESPVGRGSCLENSKLLKVRGFDSLSLRTVIAIRRWTVKQMES